jgi:hypothetical protein
MALQEGPPQFFVTTPHPSNNNEDVMQIHLCKHSCTTDLSDGKEHWRRTGRKPVENARAARE